VTVIVVVVVEVDVETFINWVPAYWLELRRGIFTCDGWQATLCDPYGKCHPATA